MNGEISFTSEEIEGWRRTLNDLRGLKDRLEALEKKGDGSAQIRVQLDRVTDEILKIQTRMNRPGVGNRESGAPSEAKRAFLKLVRTNTMDALTADERAAYKAGVGAFDTKALTIGTDTAGGFLVPEDFARDIVKDIVEYSPIRAYARVRTTSSTSLKVPKRTGTSSASWFGETGTRSDTGDPTYGLAEVPTHDLYAKIDTSRWELEDAAFDMEREIRQEMTEQFSVSEGQAFVDGDGVNKPKGFLQESDLTGSGNYIAGGNASDLDDGDKLIDLYTSIKGGYGRNAVFGMNLQTWGTVLQLKTGSGDWLIGRNLDQAMPMQILGRAVVELPDMPDIGADAYPIVFANFRELYTVVDRTGMFVQRDSVTQVASGLVRFWGIKRVGGQTVNTSAGKLLKIAAA